MSGPYALSVDLYRQRGWLEVLPLPPRQKTPPPAGFTGAKHVHVVPTIAQIDQWRVSSPDGNVALRMPPNVVGIDVDAYGDKIGAQSLATAVEAWGELPATWRLTSRTDGVSGIRFFRVPEGLAWPSIVGPGIEMVHRGHRYAVAWPSVHPDTGLRYEWLRDGQNGPQEPPSLGELPFLPPTWIEGLTGGQEAVATTHANADRQTITRSLDEWETAGSPCRQVLSKVAEVDAALNGAPGSRHDQVRDRLLKVIRLGQVGHAGVGWAMDHIGELFVDVIGAERGHSTAEHEWEQIQRGGVDIILGDIRPAERCFGDRCEFGTIPSLDHLPVIPSPQPLTIDPFTATAGVEDEHPIYTDLSWLLTGEVPPQILPTVMTRADGKALFYRGKVNGLFGEPETAKTWLALLAIVAELEAGGRAVYLDVDHNGAVELAQRLVQLGAPAYVLADARRFRVAEPESAIDCVRLLADLHEWKPTLAVIDSLGELIPMLGAASKDNDDVTRALRFIVKPLAHKIGAAVVTIDHVAKGEGGRDGYAIGGQAKKRAMDGAYISMRVDGGKIPAPGRVGRVGLFVEKDRQGNVRRNAIAKRWGTFVLDSATNAMLVDAGAQSSILASVEEPAAGPTASEAALTADPAVPVALMEQISQHLEVVAAVNPENGLGSNAIATAVGANKAKVLAACAALEERGYVKVVAGPNRSKLHIHQRRFSAVTELVAEGARQAGGPVVPSGSLHGGTTLEPLAQPQGSGGSGSGPPPLGEEPGTTQPGSDRKPPVRKKNPNA